MSLKGLALENIRTYDNFSLNFNQPITMIVGPNASGKTTIIEAIHLLATGNSFRAGKIDEVIRFGSQLGRIKGLLEDADTQKTDTKKTDTQKADQIDLELTLTRGIVQNKKTAKRLYSVNGIRRQKRTFTQNLACVVFRPEDMRLIEGSPTRRRSFLDETLVQISKEYERSLHTYHQTLIRRNRLLLNIREGEQSQSSLEFWNLSLVKHGELIQELRQKLLHFLTSQSFSVAFTAHYLPSLITADRLNEYQSREIAAGHTLIGPHKDDFMVELSKIAAGKHRTIAVDSYGSRGEQRLAVLWLKIGQLSYLENKLEDKPILLLDDILSELDADSQNIATAVMKKYQTVITSTDRDMIEVVKAQFKNIQLIKSKIADQTS